MVDEVALSLLCHTRRDNVLVKVLDSISNPSFPKKQISLILIDSFSTNGADEIVELWLGEIAGTYRSLDHIRAKGIVPHLRNIVVKKALEFQFAYNGIAHHLCRK